MKLAVIGADLNIRTLLHAFEIPKVGGRVACDQNRAALTGQAGGHIGACTGIQLLIGIAIVLIAVGAGFAVVASQDAAVNSRVKDAICSFQFDTAETLRGDVKLFPAGDNSLRTEIIRTGRLYQAGQYTQALMYLDDLRETYTDADLAAYSGVLDTIEAKSLPQI